MSLDTYILKTLAEIFGPSKRKVKAGKLDELGALRLVRKNDPPPPTLSPAEKQAMMERVKKTKAKIRKNKKRRGY